MSKPIQSVQVVGGGTAGFLAALTIRRMLPDLQVSLVRSTKIPVIGVGESTTPFFPRHLHDYLDIDRKAFFAEVRPSWKIGVRFEWGPPGDGHFNYPFDDDLDRWHPPLTWVDAYYCLNNLRDQSQRSAMMDLQRSPIIRAKNGYRVDRGSAYHIENRALIAFLEKQAPLFGVKVIDGDVIDVQQSESGHVDCLQLEDGRQLVADLFIDCTGFRALLLERTLKEKFVPYETSLFCDSAVIGSFPRRGTILPYTTAETMEHGWCWRIEFENHVTRGYVFASDFCNEEEAMRELKQKNPELRDDLHTVRFRRGRYENFWQKNVAAIGNASGFVEPLEATALHMIVAQLQYLLQGLKDSNFQTIPEIQKVQNALYRDIWDDARDFLAIHHRFNRRCDSEYWLHCRSDTDLAGAEDLVTLYHVAGPTQRMKDLLPRNSIFGYTGYATLLMGQQVNSAFQPQVNNTERQQWESLRQQYRVAAANALPVREALDLVRNPLWQWPPGVLDQQPGT